MLQAQETVVEIDLNGLEHNFNTIKALIKPSTKVLAVVKAFGYGSDSISIAKHLEKLGVDYFAVAYTNEGVALRDAGIQTPILVLHPQPINFETLIDRCLEPNLYNTRILDAFIAVAKQKKQKAYPIHIKFNTGLNRLGFLGSDVTTIVKKLVNTPQLKVASLFSHLAASEVLEEANFTREQIRLLKSIAKEFEFKIGYKPKLHQLNTSGIFNYANEAQFDMVRVGIGLYGFANDLKKTETLKNVISLKSVISQIHNIEKGDTVGYNRSFKAAHAQKIATIPIGHADGIHRALGNGRGHLTIYGQKAPIVGNVCMDMLMVDVTNIACKEGDEVIVFDSQKAINALAKQANTISYEILTAISQRIKRVVK